MARHFTAYFYTIANKYGKQVRLLLAINKGTKISAIPTWRETKDLHFAAAALPWVPTKFRETTSPKKSSPEWTLVAARFDANYFLAGDLLTKSPRPGGDRPTIFPQKITRWLPACQPREIQRK